MKTKTLKMLLVFALVAGIAASGAYAGGGYGSKDKGMDLDSKFCKKAGMMLSNETELGLTADQVKKIKELKNATKKSIIMKTAEISVIELDLEAMMWENKINVEEVNKLVDKKYELKKEKTKTMVSAISDLKGILSDAQMTKLKELYKQSKAEMSGMSGMSKCKMCGMSK